LEAREFYRLGGQTPIKMNARVIATTNRKLTDCVRAGTFREDLYYRLDVLRLEVPALAERSRDIPLFVDHFLNELTKGTARRIRLSPEVYYFLCQRRWEGNIRELKNFVTRMFYLAETEVVTINDIGNETFGVRREESASLPFFTIGTNLSLEEMEKKYILQTLNVSKGNKSQAARMLQISLKTLRNKLKCYQMDAASAS
jgi:DNA-binding NtrC family response regulator